MSWLTSFLHPERGYKNAQNTLDKYYNEGQGYVQPYNQFGQDQFNTLQEFINNLKDPKKLQDEWSKGYTESESAKNAESMAQEHGLNAASSLGLMGSNTALDAIQSGTTKIGLDERQRYLDDLMNKYITGAGIAGNIFGTGAGAATTQSQNANNMGTNSAGLTFGATNAPGQNFGNILGTIGKFAGNYLTGGFGKGDYGRGAWSTTGG